MTQSLSPLCKTIFLALPLLLNGCFWHSYLPTKVENQIEKAYTNKTYWLKQSLFTGPFYDDDRLRLADSKSFDSLDYLQTPDSEVILPPPSELILPANTHIFIQKIEWPEFSQLLTRPLYTPRHYAWLFFKTNSHSSPIKLREDKSHIIVIPKQIQTAEDFSFWFDTLFSPQNLASWMSSLSPEEQKAIEKKLPVIGMSFDALVATLGTPDSLRTLKPTAGNKQRREAAFFGKMVVYLEDGRVTQISQVKEVQQEELVPSFDDDFPD